MIAIYFYIFILLLCGFFNLIGLNETIISYIFIALSTITILIIIFFLKTNTKTKLIITVGLLIRLIFLFIDIYFYRLPHANSDDESFYKYSLLVYSNPRYLLITVSRGFYPKFLSIFYYFIGTNRIGIQFTNVLFSTASIIYLVKILHNLNIREKYINISTLIMAFAPNFLFLNSILRRDTIITLLIFMSIYYLSKWYNDKKIKNFVLSILLIFFATVFHTAIIFAVPIYILFFGLYDAKKNKFKLNSKKIVPFVLLTAIILGISIYYFNNFNNKFTALSDEESLYRTINSSRGGSAYLTNMKVNNVWQLLLFTPFKLAYFLFSPMPWNFRGLSDVSSFILDSCIYISLFYILVKNKIIGFSKIMFYSFLIISIVFSLGTFTSGTAIRHRYNIIPYLLVCDCYALNENIKKGELKSSEKNN